VFEAAPFIIPQQPADTDPDPPFAPPCQLLEMNGLLVGVIRQKDEQAAFEVKDHVAQMHTIFPFSAAAARATDEPRELPIRLAAGDQSDQANTFGQGEFATHNQLNTQLFGGDVCFNSPCQRALVGNGQSVIATTGCTVDEFLGCRGAAQKAVVGQAVKFGVHKKYCINKQYSNGMQAALKSVSVK